MDKPFGPAGLEIDVAYYNRLDIPSFLLMLKDPSYCYKFYWLEAIVKLILEGVTETTFDPEQPLSTAHIATFLYRTLNPGADGWYEAAAGWMASWNCPFAANLQMIFYRSKKAGEPVLVKFLVNERETAIPAIKAVAGPYYKWEDVKASLN